MKNKKEQPRSFKTLENTAKMFYAKDGEPKGMQLNGAEIFPREVESRKISEEYIQLTITVLVSKKNFETKIV